MRSPIPYLRTLSPTAPSDANTLSLHDALPIFLEFPTRDPHGDPIPSKAGDLPTPDAAQLSTVEPSGQAIVERISDDDRSEEHTSELQSRGHLVCRLLLEKKNIHTYNMYRTEVK